MPAIDTRAATLQPARHCAPRLFRSAMRSALLAAALAAPLTAHAAGSAIELEVDLRDTAHRSFRVQEVLPAAPGPLVLRYAKWIPGEHGPSGTIDDVSGLQLHAGGQRLRWHRDLEDMFQIVTEVPAGAQAVEVDFDFLSPGAGRNFGASASVTPSLAVLEWNQVAFYPAGHAARDLQVRARARLPEGWSWASALLPAAPAGATPAAGTVDFEPVSLETLIDSPLLAARHLAHISLASEPVEVTLHLAADRTEDLRMSAEQMAQHRRMVREAMALFGARHYPRYDFLLVLSEHVGHFGLEHHASSDDRTNADFLTDPDSYLLEASLLPHEYVHSWNGKFRRPDGLLTGGYDTPMKGDLLWVYEGLTNYLGEVLAARSGMRSPEQAREDLAATAAAMSAQAGRAWRPLQDTADAAQLLYNSPGAWSNWRRSVDFYSEGTLLWLEIDARLRERSAGRRSLDDFVRAFFGREDGRVQPLGYRFEDVVTALDAVVHEDWAGWLRTRLDATGSDPLGGLVQAGWRLVFNDQAGPVGKAADKASKSVDLRHGAGLRVDTGDSAGSVLDVAWGGPAFRAGLAPGMRIAAVDGMRFTPERLTASLTAAREGSTPVSLLVEDAEQFRTLQLDWHGGLRYPHLERDSSRPDLLGAILTGRAAP
jgi:predicted metalloprotease with PDZ domain